MEDIIFDKFRDNRDIELSNRVVSNEINNLNDNSSYIMEVAFIEEDENEPFGEITVYDYTYKPGDITSIASCFADLEEKLKQDIKLVRIFCHEFRGLKFRLRRHNKSIVDEFNITGSEYEKVKIIANKMCLR